MAAVQEIPTLDFGLLNGRKNDFISQLRHILVNVGFLYLANPPVSQVHTNPYRRSLAALCVQFVSETALHDTRTSLRSWSTMPRDYSTYRKRQKTNYSCGIASAFSGTTSWGQRSPKEPAICESNLTLVLTIGMIGLLESPNI